MMVVGSGGRWWVVMGDDGRPQRPVPAHSFWLCVGNLVLQRRQEPLRYACLGENGKVDIYLYIYSVQVFSINRKIS